MTIAVMKPEGWHPKAPYHFVGEVTAAVDRPDGSASAENVIRAGQAACSYS